MHDYRRDSRDEQYYTSALLTGSFERWRHRYYRAPFALAPQFSQMQPLAVEEVQAFLHSAPDGHERSFVQGCLEHDLRKCRHPDYHYFKRSMRSTSSTEIRASGGDAAWDTAAGTSDSPKAGHRRGSNDDSELSIDFDIEKQETTVTVWSYFSGFQRAKAKRILTAAEPPNWARAAPMFFVETVPGEWLGDSRFDIKKEFREKELREKKSSGKRSETDEADRQIFEKQRNDALKALEKYQFWEHVAWDFSPQMTGGAINILEITKKPLEEKPRDFADRVLDQIEKFTDGEDKDEATQKAQRVRTELPKAGPQHKSTGKYAEYFEYADGTLSKSYEYELVRCKQSKILSSWEEGGLDVDDGHYHAVWLPTKRPDIGTLLIEAQKKVHYSRRADVIPGTANVLNLLAPAIIGMLMTQLAFSKIRSPGP